MSAGDDATMEESKEMDIKLDAYVPIIAKNTQLHSTYDAEYIFDQLRSKL